MPLFFLFRVIVMYGFGGGFVTGVLDSLHDDCSRGMWGMMRGCFEERTTFAGRNIHANTKIRVRLTRHASVKVTSGHVFACSFAR